MAAYQHSNEPCQLPSIAHRHVSAGAEQKFIFTESARRNKTPPPIRVANKTKIGTGSEMCFSYLFSHWQAETDGSAPAELIFDFRCLVVGHCQMQRRRYF